VLEEVARDIGLTITSTTQVRDAVMHYLRAQATLLVIDSCEHALAASRERMRLPAEARHALPALPAGNAGFERGRSNVQRDRALRLARV
jgi:hypothetical protein